MFNDGHLNEVHGLLERRDLAESIAQLVERVVRVAAELGREVATPAQAREIPGL